MYTKATLIAAILAVAEARFGQEQGPSAEISALGNFGNPGEAPTLAGQVPGVLLAAADPCDKLTLADQIVDTLGNDPEVITAAQKLVAAEQNFNPFAVSVPNICGDASLPATEELRGIVPAVDPDVGGSDVENTNSEQSLQTPFDAAGLSVADIMIAQGFSNFTVNGAPAGDGAGAGAGAGGNADEAGNAGGDAAQTTATATATATAAPSKTRCARPSATTTAAANNGGNNNADDTADNGNNAGAGAVAEGDGAVDDPVTGTFLGFEASSLGLDFGSCVPTVKFEESLNGRKAGESTFQAIDPKVNQGQNEALNPAIIFNRICDQLVNVCDAADDAVEACKEAQAELSTGPKDETTANAWNEALGFAGTDINPDSAPKEGLVGHT